MTANTSAPAHVIPTALMLLLRLIAAWSRVSVLSGCQPQPKSMFEQQAEDNTTTSSIVRSATPNSANYQSDLSTNHTKASKNAAVTISSRTSGTIDMVNHKIVAQQLNCDPIERDCQYFELNVPEFLPEQPWLATIMWQTIARILAPESPLASQEKTAQKTVSMRFNQIEYAEQRVKALPLYHRIDTKFVLNPTNNQSSSRLQSGKRKNREPVNIVPVSTGYLKIRSSQHRQNPEQQSLHYVMLDMEKKLILNIDDILLPNISTAALLPRFQMAKEGWLQSHNGALSSQYPQSADLKNQEGINKGSLDKGSLNKDSITERTKTVDLQGSEDIYEEWSVPLASQWYLDDEGLHLVYQSGELLAAQSEVVDLLAPYSKLHGLIDPKYNL